MDEPVTAGSAPTTREQILVTALELFSQRGYDATSLRQIADAMHITKAAIYYHFPAKDHLAIELAKPFLDALSNLVTFATREEKNGFSGAHGIPGRGDLLADYLDLFVTHHTVVQFLSRDPAAQQHPDVGQRARALVSTLQNLLAGPNAATAERIRAGCALGAVHAVALLTREEVREARDVILGAALAALRAGSGDDA